ncbi:MAG: iron-containing redox enzyme family protein [Deltaproteobacteria bacterium]|nr:iron-containing redox enzyme family protein [Deltaproteobacteria bacterium]
MGDVYDLQATLDRMVNEQFETPEFKRFLSVPLTMERARFFVLQNALYTKNRRDCWGYIQGSAPLDVKALVWKHESDELINDPRCNTDHFSLCVKQGEVLGLTPEDFETAQLPPMARACFYAWIHIATRNHWLTAFTSSQMLERRNNGQIVKGGGLSLRVGKKFEKELGIELKKMVSLDVHAVADTEHSDMMAEVYLRYATTPEAQNAVLQGARESMAIDRAYRGALATMMEEIN